MATTTKTTPPKGTPARDKLDRNELAASYKAAVGLIYSVPELQGIITNSLNTGGTDAQLQAAIQSSDWYLNNAEYFRIAWAKQNIGGADWVSTQQEARLAVQSAVTSLGSKQPSPEEIDALTQRYLFEGWGEPDRAQLMNTVLSKSIGVGAEGSMKGAAGNLQTQLKNMAVANGVPLSDSYYESAARSVASNLSTANDWVTDVRNQAASLWPPFADKIMAGVDVQSLASGYVNTMADTFDIDRGGISLNDPYIRQALTGVNEKGEPVPTSLWEFRRSLRKDPRWLDTPDAQNSITSATGNVLKMFGLTG